MAAERITESVLGRSIRVIEGSGSDSSGHPQPYWPWCPMPGALRSTQMAVDTAAFGDGYVHRSTRGLNPARPSWALVFPFTSLNALNTFDSFLTAYATAGFWMQPPDSPHDVFVTVDAWSASISDKNATTGIVGTLQATFNRSFNPQPIPMPI